MLKLLLISTDPNDEKELKRIVSLDGYRLFFADNISKVFDILESEEISGLFCASQIGKLKGTELFLSLKSKITAKGIPFFLITNKDLKKKELIVYLEFGFDNLIFRPFNESTILIKLKNLNQRRSFTDLFEVNDLYSFIKTSQRPMAIVKNDQIVKANSSFWNLTNMKVDSKSNPIVFSKAFPIKEDELHQLDLFRFSNQLLESVQLKNISFSIEKSFDLRLFRGQHSSKFSFLVEIEAERFSGVELDLQTYSHQSFALLTNREKEVFWLSEKGYPMKEIADRLSLSIRTVERHRSNIMKKMDSSNILEAISKAKLTLN